MYASKPSDITTPESSGRSLLVIASALALIDGLLYLIGQLGTAYILPKLRALTTVARYFAAHTTDPAAQLVIEALRNGDIYLHSQLLAARDTLLAAHDQYVHFLWRTCLFGFVAWCGALLLFRLLRAWYEAAHAPPPCASPKRTSPSRSTTILTSCLSPSSFAPAAPGPVPPPNSCRCSRLAASPICPATRARSCSA